MTDLVTQNNELAALLAPKESDIAKADFAKEEVASYLPYMQLIQNGKHKAVKDKIAAEGDLYIDALKVSLGNDVDVVPLRYEAKAMELEGSSVIQSLNDPEDAEFQRIVKKSKLPNTMGAMAGTEWLLYIPEHDVIVTHFLYNKSSKPLHSVYDSNVGKCVNLKTDTRVNPKGQEYWCANAFAVDREPQLPAVQQLKEAIAKHESSFMKAEAPDEEAVNTDDR